MGKPVVRTRKDIQEVDPTKLNNQSVEFIRQSVAERQAEDNKLVSFLPSEPRFKLDEPDEHYKIYLVDKDINLEQYGKDNLSFSFKQIWQSNKGNRLL